MRSGQGSVTPLHGARRHRGKSSRRLAALFASDRARYVAFGCFILVVALTGGGSRSDIPSLLLLRPLAVLFSAYALLLASPSQLREVWAALLIIVAAMILCLLQLVPLPADVWASLPQRDVIALPSRYLGMEDVQRPISLDPNRTWNTLFALVVPLAVVCLAAIQAPQYRKRMMLPLMAVGLLSAILGLLQAIGGNGLHLYEISHSGYPVGLFANKNHQAVLLLWLMLASSWIITKADLHHHSPTAAIGGAIALILVLFSLLVLTGSRAGLLLIVPTLALSAWLLFRSPAMGQILRRWAGRAKLAAGAIAAILIMPLLFVFGALAMSGRETALSRLFELNAAEDLRWSYLPIFQKMALDYLPFGSGFGSFESVFKIYEPAEMLTSRYMNQAHNDLLQILIEGGLPALAILMFAFVWLFWAVRRVWQQGREGQLAAGFYGGGIALWLAASLVDYPLRTPFAAMLVAALTAQLSFLSTPHRSGHGEPAEADVRTASS